MMTLRAVFVAVSILLACAGVAQQDGLKKANRKPVKLTGAQGPVTHQEANATFARMDKLIGSLPGLKSYKPGARAKKAGTASRGYIVVEFNKMFEKVKPIFRFTPKAVRFDAKRLVIPAGQKPALGDLIKWGFVAKVGPLATGPKDTIGLREFGDAVGLFMARVSDLTHSPDVKYSPWMKDKIGG